MTSAKEIYETTINLVKKYRSRNPVTISKSLGIKVFFSDELGNLLGLYTYMIKNRVIILNSKLSDYQMNMVLAHEIGHDQLHKELAKTGLQEYHIFDLRSLTEYEANAFAAHLLIDTGELIETIKDFNYDLEKLASYFSVDINMILIKMQELNRMGYNIAPPIIPNPRFLKKSPPNDSSACI